MPHTRQQGCAIILPEGPHVALDLDEEADQVVLETNPSNENRRLTEIRA